MKIFVQTVDGEFPNINFLTAYLGFKEMGFEVIKFDFSELDTLPLDRESVVYGGIPVVTAALKKISIEPPMLKCYPDELRLFLGREVEAITIKEAREKFHAGKNFFMKPVDNCHKIFVGHTITKFRDLIYTAGVPDDTLVFTSELMEFLTEYRVFVLNGLIVGAKNYRGDFSQIIDFDTVKRAITQYTSPPLAYALDFGLTKDLETKLVEVNDVTSLGCYGLTAVFFANLILFRWAQLVDQDNKKKAQAQTQP